MTDDRDPSRIPFRAMIPNAITTLALCFGLTGVSLAIGGEWDKAIGAIVLAGILDGFDGRIARLLRAESKFGACSNGFRSRERLNRALWKPGRERSELAFDQIGDMFQFSS